MTLEITAHPFHQRLHTQMIRVDEWTCRRLTLPAQYDGGSDNLEAHQKLIEFLHLFALGRAQALYDNGLPVPRSLFHSRAAALLLSQHGSARRLVRTPYFFGSARPIVMQSSDMKTPWGPFARNPAGG